MLLLTKALTSTSYSSTFYNVPRSNLLYMFTQHEHNDDLITLRRATGMVAKLYSFFWEKNESIVLTLRQQMLIDVQIRPHEVQLCLDATKDVLTVNFIWFRCIVKELTDTWNYISGYVPAIHMVNLWKLNHFRSTFSTTKMSRLIMLS